MRLGKGNVKNETQYLGLFLQQKSTVRLAVLS